MQIVLYSRRGCHLCERAEDMLLFYRPTAEIVDVDTAADLATRYGLRVPVVEIDGVPVLEGNFDERTLVARLAATFETPAANVILHDKQPPPSRTRP